VGKRNHKFFLGFASWTTIHSIITAALAGLYVYEHKYGTDNDDESWSTKHIVGFVLTIFTVCIVFCVGGLACYHGKLACGNQTTNEEIRGKYDHGNPYDQGCSTNCKAFLFKGLSRVYEEDYDLRSVCKTEPNVFLIVPVDTESAPNSARENAAAIANQIVSDQSQDNGNKQGLLPSREASNSSIQGM